MESIAKGDSHGYDQIHRMGPDFDCSGLNITGWVEAGVPVNKAVKKTVTVNGNQKTVTTPGATYTGNIRNAYLAHGFSDVTNSIDLKTGRGLKRGDVLLREGHHVAQYCGNGKEVEASINEKGKTTGGKPGDQTGREILIRNYRNYPWDHVLRYNDSSKTTPAKFTEPKTNVSRYTSNSKSEVKWVQSKLNKFGYKLAVDGDFGERTYNAVVDFQKNHNLAVDGIVGKNTRKVLKMAKQMSKKQQSFDKIHTETTRTVTKKVATKSSNTTKRKKK